MKTILKSVAIICIVAIIASCKKGEVIVKPKLTYVGTWNASYVYNENLGSVYRWTATLTINNDGTAVAIHQPGNPIMQGQVITENFKWGIVDDHTMYLRSQNWSITHNTMDYQVQQYGHNYIYMTGFDDNFEYWQLTLRK